MQSVDADADTATNRYPRQPSGVSRSIGKAARFSVPFACWAVMQLGGSASARAQIYPVTRNGPPPLIRPTYQEVGLPTFSIPEGALSVLPPSAPGGPSDPGTGGGSAGGGLAQAVLDSRSWGYAAGANAESIGVSSAAIAATCVVESGCNPAVTGAYANIQGAFQTLGTTYDAAIRKVAAENPTIASRLDMSRAGQLDPANQAFAAAQELKDIARLLQANGIANPTVMDTRPGYQFGQGYAVRVAEAADTDPLGSILKWKDDSTWKNNGLTRETTVGEWRDKFRNKVGSSADAAVLSSPARTISASTDG